MRDLTGFFSFTVFTTVRDHQANSHAKKGWEMFTDAAIRAISQRRTGVVFLLWGKPAQEKIR
jgi:uracil-DNA glycosylase